MLYYSRMKTYWVYIVTNAQRTVLYVGMTNNLERRLYEHSERKVAGFTASYRCSYWLYYEETQNVEDAIAREKQFKKWSRAKKEILIDTLNPNREDFSTSPQACGFGRDDRFGLGQLSTNATVPAEDTL